jgi:hypothetical protein
MDAGNYIRNSSLSRKETTGLIRDINSARSPAERYERSLNRLDKALKAGAIDQGTYNRLLDQAKTKLNKTAKSTDGFATSLKTLAGSYIGLQTLRSGFSAIGSEMQRIDQVAKSARGIGETFANVERFRMAASEIAGISGPEAIGMLGKLTKRIGEADMGMGEAVATFQRLNLNVRELKDLSPVDQFHAVAKAFGSIESPTLKVAEANKLFEESGVKLIPLLNATKTEFQDSASSIDKFGKALSEIEVSKIEAANDAINRLNESMGSLATTIAAEAVDTGAVGFLDDLSYSIQRVSDAAQIGGSVMKDAWGFVSGGGMSITRMSKMDPLDLLPSTSATINKMVDEYEEFIKPRAKLAKRPTPGSQPGTISGIDDAMESGLNSLGTSIQGGFDQLGGVFGAVGGFIAQANQNALNNVVEAQKESPAIKSLEVGTQGAYAFLTDSINEQKKQEAAEAAKRERIAKNTEKLAEKMEELKAAWNKMGFRRL